MGFVLRLDSNKNKNDEYSIKCFKNGNYYEPGVYYTKDWRDAILTLKDMAKDYNLRVSKTDTGYVAK